MEETPLSRPEGWTREPRDFYWLERNIPCRFACPARTDIPGYLAAISKGDFEQAYRINLADNVFPGGDKTVDTWPPAAYFDAQASLTLYNM